METGREDVKGGWEDKGEAPRHFVRLGPRSGISSPPLYLPPLLSLFPFRPFIPPSPSVNKLLTQVGIKNPQEKSFCLRAGTLPGHGRAGQRERGRDGREGGNEGRKEGEECPTKTRPSLLLMQGGIVGDRSMHAYIPHTHNLLLFLHCMCLL